MNTENQQVAINSCSDIITGCGLSVKPKTSTVSIISVGNTFNLAKKTFYTTISAPMALSFEFEAGYTIQADFIVSASGCRDTGAQTVTDLQSLIDIVKEAEIEIEIEMDESYDLPFNNWQVVADNYAILKDLIELSDDYLNIEFDANNYSLSEPVVYTCEPECSSVAYGLRDIISDLDSKHQTGFTEAVVNKLQDQIKTEMISGLIAREAAK